MKYPRWIWATGSILAGSCFLAYEIPAARNDTPGDTLSEFVWWLTSTSPIVAILIAIPLIWLATWLPFHLLLPKSKVDRFMTSIMKKLFRIQERD